MREKKALLAVAASAILLTGGWVLYGAVSDNTAEREAAEPQHISFRDWEEQIVDEGLREASRDPGQRPLAASFGGAEGMPKAMREAVRATMGPLPRLELRLDEAQYVETPLGLGLWLAEGKEVACVFLAKTATSRCDTSTNATRRGLLLQTLKPPTSPGARPTDFRTLGVVPDWAKAATLKVGGASRTLPVVGNAFGLEAEAFIRFQRLVR